MKKIVTLTLISVSATIALTYFTVLVSKGKLPRGEQIILTDNYSGSFGELSQLEFAPLKGRHEPWCLSKTDLLTIKLFDRVFRDTVTFNVWPMEQGLINYLTLEFELSKRSDAAFKALLGVKPYKSYSICAYPIETVDIELYEVDNIKITRTETTSDMNHITYTVESK